jgi:hypothetical protein
MNCITSVRAWALRHRGQPRVTVFATILLATVGSCGSDGLPELEALDIPSDPSAVMSCGSAFDTFAHCETPASDEVGNALGGECSGRRRCTAECIVATGEDCAQLQAEGADAAYARCFDSCSED